MKQRYVEKLSNNLACSVTQDKIFKLLGVPMGDQKDFGKSLVALATLLANSVKGRGRFHASYDPKRNKFEVTADRLRPQCDDSVAVGRYDDEGDALLGIIGYASDRNLFGYSVFLEAVEDIVLPAYNLTRGLVIEDEDIQAVRPKK